MKIMSKILSFIIIIIILSSIAIAWTPQSDIELRDYYAIHNATNITAEKFIGDGSKLTGVLSSFADNATYAINATYAETANSALTANSANTANSSLYWNDLNYPSDISISDLNPTGEADLNVNSSNYWDGLNTPNDINTGDLNNDGTYILSSDESSLDVNSANTATSSTSTTFWASVSSFVSKWFYDNGDVLSFNETLLNSTIDARDTDTTYSNEQPISLIGTQFGLTPCPNGQVYAYNSTTPAWQCESKLSSGGGTVTSVDSGTGLLGGPITSSGTLDIDKNYFDTNYYNQTSADGLFILLADESNLNVNSSNYWDGLNTPSELDDTHSHSASTITSVNWNTLQSYPTGCSVGDYVRVIGDTLTCGTDIDTTYTAGNGISLSTTTFNVAAGNGLTQDASGLSTNALTAGASQYSYWDGNSWEVRTDENTEYTVTGTLLDLSSTTFSVNEGTLTNSYLCTYITGTGLVCNTDPTSLNYISSLSAGNGMDFSTITSTGSVTMGTPGDLSSESVNAVTSTSHTHKITSLNASIINNFDIACPDGSFVQTVNMSDESTICTSGSVSYLKNDGDTATGDYNWYGNTLNANDVYWNNENGYISSGLGNRFNFATNAYYSNGGWVFPGATSGGMMYINEVNDFKYFTHDGAGAFTQRFGYDTSEGTFEVNGNLTATNFLTLGTPTFVTISSGSVTVTSSNVYVIGEGSVADDLDCIVGGVEGTILHIYARLDASDITFKQSNCANVDNSLFIDGAADFTTTRGTADGLICKRNPNNMNRGWTCQTVNGML